MSFRSAWRHAAKTSPSQHHVSKRDGGSKVGTSEPTLVVTDSRPSSAHDPKSDKPEEVPAETTAESNGGNGVVEPDKDNVATEAREPEQTNVKEPERTSKETTAQDAQWFSWWGSAKSESSAPTQANGTGVKEPSESERPKTAPESTKTAPESPKTALESIPATAPLEQPPPLITPPSEPVAIKPQHSVSDTSNGSYLAWIWSSRSPSKTTSTESEKPTLSEPVTENGIQVKSIDHPTPQEAPSTKLPESSTTKPPEPVSSITVPNPLITTLPQTRSSWMSFWARSESMPDLNRKIGPETMKVPDDVDPQGRPFKKQKTDDKPLDMAAAEINASIKSNKTSHTPTPSVVVPTTPSKSLTSPSSPSKDTPTKPKKDKNGKDKIKAPPPPNHVLPEFETVYPSILTKESFLTRVTKAILPHSSSPHLALHAHPHRCAPPIIQKAVAIGIHGFFPLKILRSIIGEPTGTSVKFATLASEAIHRYSERQYGSSNAVEVVKIALEGEGTIAARVDMLWKNLSGKEEWMDHVREADLILVACHSQGSPVGAGIMARLVEEGIVSESTRLGLLCVAGIHLGPAMDVGQRVVMKAYNAIESEAARELYDSTVSRRYIEALRTILAHDTRVTIIGSIDDHLVPMYSSTFSTAYHGSIYRAVFIDGRIHETDFLARLVAFALRLRNEGWRDHGIMTELSSALMGNFYTGEGHSRIYDEPAVYDLALRHTLETTSMKTMPLHIEPFKARTTPNPYLLPWSMRGVMEETVRGPLSHELDELREEFGRWEPKGPKLKDLKWRMEGWSSVRPKI